MIAILRESAAPDDLEDDLLEQAALLVLANQNIHAADLTLVLTGDERLQSLNRDFLGIESTTDVLSFPAAETDPETGRPYLGDVVISLPRAARQASQGGHSLTAEVQLLVVHGVLHLLGHDHAGAEEKNRMWAAQDEALERLGLKGIRIGE
ncbi:MAG: rRNA maturation RNase YbeY [Chloroflexi bacterium]|nr:rRNA maturation RNase YbeY [Chloroflexota bacterium]